MLSLGAELFHNRAEVERQIQGVAGAAVEIFSNKDVALRWWWYGRAVGFNKACMM